MAGTEVVQVGSVLERGELVRATAFVRVPLAVQVHEADYEHAVEQALLSQSPEGAWHLERVEYGGERPDLEHAWALEELPLYPPPPRTHRVDQWDGWLSPSEPLQPVGPRAA